MIYFNSLSNTYSSTKMESTSLSIGFTSREVGDGRDIETILSFLRINQVIFKTLVVAQQIHSSNIIFYEEASQGVVFLPDTDGIVTTEKGTVLAVRTADCVPILYYDPKSGLIGVSHNGWRGTLKKISSHIIEKMVEKGAKKEHIIVALGPGIGGCCYEINEDLYFEFMGEFEDEMGAFGMHGGKRHLNIAKINFELLKKEGINPKNIDFFPFCTMCNKDKFFSFRRDHKKHPEKFGEMFSYIVRN